MGEIIWYINVSMALKFKYISTFYLKYFFIDSTFRNHSFKILNFFFL